MAGYPDSIVKQMHLDNRCLFDIGVNEPDRPRFNVKEAGRWKTITWGQVLDYALTLSNFFLELKVGKGVKIAVYARNHVEWAYIDAGIRVVGGVFVPVYASNTATQVQYIIDHSDAEIVVIDMEHFPLLAELLHNLPKVRKIVLVDLGNDGQMEQVISASGQKTTLLQRQKDGQFVSFYHIVEKYGEQDRDRLSNLLEVSEKAQPDDVSAILYTSGTTGDPKGVVLSRYNLYVNARDWIDVLGDLMPTIRVDLLWLPMSHIFGWGELGLGNTLGFETYLTTHIDVLSDMMHVKPTIFMSVPAYWEKLYEQAKGQSEQKAEQLSRLQELTGGRLQFCLSGGAGLKREIKEFYHEAGLLIIEGYGLTECSPSLTMNRKNDFDFDTVGKPFPSVEVKLAEDGEILAKGPNIFQEYHKNPQATLATFDDDGWLKTGDIGEFTEKGFLKIQGRKKEIIVTSGGKNISPQIIESYFKDDPYIEHLVVYGNEKKYLTALVTLKQARVGEYAHNRGIPHSDFTSLLGTQEVFDLVQKQIDKVNSRLASFETIKKFHLHDGRLTVETGFLTPSLKLKRNVLFTTFAREMDALYD